MTVTLNGNSNKDVDPFYNDAFRGTYKGRLLEVIYYGVSPEIHLKFNSGIVTSFSDKFTANWTGKNVVGKMDQIANYSNTVRSINAGMILVAESAEVAKRNMAQAAKLAQFTYPYYTPDATAPGKPFVEVKLMNLITNSSGTGFLNGYFKEVSLEHILDDIVFFDDKGNAFPKTIRLEFQLDILHTDSLGFDQTKIREGLMGGVGESFSNFPYGVKEGIPKQDDSITNDESGNPAADAAQKKAEEEVLNN